jgi:Family of unknown function (DUF5309)
MAVFNAGTFNPTGIFFTQFNPATLNQRSFADTILRLFPDGSAPLFGMTGQLPKAQAKVVEHGYHTKAMAFSNVEDDGSGALSGDGTIELLDTAGLIPGMVLQVRSTRELVLVLTVPNATDITVTRGYGSVAAAAIPASDILFAVGNSHEQASNRPVARTMEVLFIPNYTQIVRNSWAISDTARASLAEAGFNNIQESRQDAMLLHATDIESILFFGQPQPPAGSPPVHTTQGIIDAVFQYAPTNVTTAAATTNYDQLVAIVEPYFAAQSNLGNAKERIMFVDSQANRVLNEIGRKSEQVIMDLRTTTFGMHFTAFRTYKGMIFIVEHPLFNGLNITPGFAVTVELPSMRLAYMNGRDVKKEEFGQNRLNPGDNGIDAQGGSLTSEFATEFRNPCAYGIINELTAGVA